MKKLLISLALIAAPILVVLLNVVLVPNIALILFLIEPILAVIFILLVFADILNLNLSDIQTLL